jgi:hypothetical protein
VVHSDWGARSSAPAAFGRAGNYGKTRTIGITEMTITSGVVASHIGMGAVSGGGRYLRPIHAIAEQINKIRILISLYASLDPDAPIPN